MTSIILKATRHTSERQNALRIDPSLRTIKSIKSLAGLELHTPQIVSKARMEACSDPRMLYSVWIMMNSLTKSLPPQLIWNWDATQFIVGQSDRDKKVYSVKLDDGSANRTPLGLVGDESLDIAIKWMFMGSAAGAAAPLVFMAAVDGLNVEECKVFAIPGLTSTVDSNAVGYLCLCPTRAGNAAFFSWFIQNIAITTVEKCRRLYELPTGLNKEFAPAFISSDGEAIVIEEVFNQDIRGLLRAENIHLGKIAASCSGILQPSDVSPLFRASKTKLRNMLNKAPPHPNPIVEAHILRALGETSEVCDVIISSTQRSKLSHGCLTVMAAIQDVIRPRLIQEGFAACGQYPQDFHKLLQQSYRDITPAQLKTMLSRSVVDEEFFLTHGHLTEDQMDSSEIPCVDHNRSVPRDQGPLHHQRAVLLTHDKTVERRQDYVNAGLPLGNAITDAHIPKVAKAQLKQDAKLVARLQKNSERVEKEKERKAGMSRQEIVNEKRDKAIARTTKKLHKETEIAAAKKRLSDAIGNTI